MRDAKGKFHELHWVSVPVNMIGWRCTGCDWSTDPRSRRDQSEAEWQRDERHRPEFEPATPLWNYLMGRT